MKNRILFILEPKEDKVIIKEVITMTFIVSFLIALVAFLMTRVIFIFFLKRQEGLTYLTFTLYVTVEIFFIKNFLILVVIVKTSTVVLRPVTVSTFIMALIIFFIIVSILKTVMTFSQTIIVNVRVRAASKVITFFISEP